MIKEQLTIEQLLQKKAVIPARQDSDTTELNQEFDEEMCRRIDRIIASIEEEES